MEKVKTYDVFFSDAYDTVCCCFSKTKEEAIDYIKTHNGTKYSYFEGYDGGEVSVVCNETGEKVYWAECRSHKSVFGH